ncbi:MAG: diguanylate cyclase [Candidatus Obscuribacterales bacterium]|nr:diguanylate cyclase [Cyanobacteria bacterium SZAS LIN-5]RTL35545.1 MAG: diguanylate cyclase [Candidatus Melainabacteria bacterium]
MKANHNILVVDDEPAHTMLISELLRRAGYTVASANDPFKALAACKVRTPDVVILDLHMPLMGGMDVFDRLRAEQKTSNIPIIFLGNREQPVPTFKVDEPNSEDILFKPFAPNELLSRVRSLLKVKALRDELKKKEEQISELTLTDPLTSLKSPRYLDEFLKTSLKQSRRYNVPISVVVLEVDQHKELIRAVGQSGAEKVVTQLAQIVDSQMRDSDIVVRTGEFELTVVLTATDVNGAIEVSERLRTDVAQKPFTADEIEFSITVSLGICQFNNNMDDEGKVLLSHARAAVSHGHMNGGNISLKAE